jgi:hypothetical protein
MAVSPESLGITPNHAGWFTEYLAKTQEAPALTGASHSPIPERGDIMPDVSDGHLIAVELYDSAISRIEDLERRLKIEKSSVSYWKARAERERDA